MVIIGGGIYGIALAHQASLSGLKTLLMEQNDFGNATSINSLRIVHGGFRYLQSLDLKRFFESVGERRWFLKAFYPLVRPIACLMPLYNKGIYRSEILGAALLTNDVLSKYRNRGIPPENHLNNGRIISAAKVKECFPKVALNGLKTGALWYDGTIDCPQRVLIEWLKAAVRKGCNGLNYTRADNIILENGRVIGVDAVDIELGRKVRFLCDVVVNTAGPWCRTLAARFDRDYEHLFRKSLAWNVLIDHPPISEYALAIKPPIDNARTYFLRPWRGLLLAGTVHEPYSGDITANPMPSSGAIAKFLNELNLAIPGIQLTPSRILHIFSGLLPAKTEGSDQLAVREVLLDHGQQGGPKGLFSVSGVKFTTARLVAEKTINRLYQNKKIRTRMSHDLKSADLNINPNIGIFTDSWSPDTSISSYKMMLEYIIQHESVIHLDDLIIRRTSLGDHPARAFAIANDICDFFSWDFERREYELQRLRDAYPFFSNS